MPKWFPAALAAGLLAVTTAGLGQDVELPGVLEEWRGWVLHGKEYLDCPLQLDRAGNAPGDYLCAWPEALQLNAGAREGEFSQVWTVRSGEAWIALPGDTEHWPDRVTVDGEPATVVLRDGVPVVRLGPGRHRLAGRFAWTGRPGTLRVPAASGLIALTVDGARVARPEVERGAVFLGERDQGPATADTLGVNVYRLVEDGVPTRLVTRLAIDVSGTVREATFGPLLPEGYVPLALQSPLPARLDADGRLRLQVRPGSWVVTLAARAPGAESEIALPAERENLPADEVWSYSANEALRISAPGGLPPVDPGQAHVPDEWQALPAFRIEPGERLMIEERSRGRADADNDLYLDRELWLDFDGADFTAVDHVRGEMRRDWRLDMQPPYRLEAASEDFEPLLVTAGAGEASAGIELRNTDVDVTAVARLETGGRVPVSGWDQRFAGVGATLYLPPGHKLLVAPGVDNASGSWAGRWRLLDFFLVLIITVAAWRLFGTAGGGVALAALVLSYQEPNAPAWLWLNLLVAAALLRVAPAGRLRSAVRVYAAASVALLVLALVPFVANQLRIAIYPQLDSQHSFYDPGRGAGPASMSVAPPEETLAPGTPGLEKRSREMADAVQGEIVSYNARIPATRRDFARYAPNAVVQTGPGVPEWQWNRYSLSWSGPVEAGQTMRLVILPRWLVSSLRVVLVLLVLGFLAIIAAHAVGRRWNLPGGIGIGPAATAALLLVVVAVPDARAAMPTPELLQELERRLTEPPDCAPRCAEISAAAVSVRGDEVSMLLAIDALEESAVPLPGAWRGWRPDLVQIDGSQAADVLRDDQQGLWVRVPAGRHAVTLRGATGDADSLEIAFLAVPRVVEVAVDGWSVAGIRDRRLLTGVLQFARTRVTGDADSPSRWEATRFPPYVEITRSIELDLDWTVTTTVSRIAPQQGAISLRVPLLPGESVLTGKLDVADGMLLASLAPQQNSLTWTSRLPRTSPIALELPAGMPWTETWRVSAGSVWNVDFDGVPESGTQAGGGVRTATFHPRGGERLAVTASRPEAVAGGTLAFDSVGLSVDQGERSRNVTLSLAYRSTRGAQHVLRFPDDAELQSVSIDGDAEPLRLEGGALTLPILPGEHGVEIEWRDPTPAGLTGRLPAVDLGAPAGNLSLTLDLPPSRWLLATSGPRLGPAVLYWSELVVLALMAWLLSRIQWTPLRFRHWLLLGLGFSTFNWAVLALVVVWLVAIGARDRWRPEMLASQYNVLQAATIGLTVIALGAIVVSLPLGLLGSPDMSVAGNGSFGNHLQWFADRTDSSLPAAVAWSLPLWAYKVLILAWALWLSLALLRWLPWTWQCFARDGFFRSSRHEVAQ